MQIKPKEFVQLGFYPDEQQVIADGIRHLLQAHPEYRQEIAIARYQRGEISLAKAAALAGLALPQLQELLRERGVPIPLGPVNRRELLRDIQAAKRALL